MPDDGQGGLTVFWFKVESAMANHPKVRKIPRDRAELPIRTAAMGLWWFAACWAAQNETDGFVPAEETERYDPDGILTPHLLASHFFEDATVGGERGYILHDWLDVQRSKDELDAARDAEAARKRTWRAAKAGRNGSTPDDDGPTGGSPVDVPPGVPPGHTNGRQEGLPLGLPPGVRSLDKTRQEQLKDMHQRSARPPRSAVRDDDPEGFAEWYQAYPRHIAVATARKAYATALRKSDVPTLLAASKRFAVQKAREKCPRDKIPYPATWLNGERWLDEPDRPVERRDPRTGRVTEFG